MSLRMAAAADWVLSLSAVLTYTDEQYTVYAGSSEAEAQVIGHAALNDEMFQSKYMKIIPHTHQWSEGWSKDTSYHWHECTADGCNITDNSEKNGYGMHTGGTATCTDKAVCTNCGEAYGNVDGTNHTNLVKTEAKPAKHLAEGNKEYYYCEGCNQYFCDKEETKKIAITDTVMPKLTEHTADASGRHSDENVHWSICECGEKLNEEAHIFEWVVGKEAT